MNVNDAIDRALSAHGRPCTAAYEDFRDEWMDAYDAGEPWAVELVAAATWARARLVVQKRHKATNRVLVTAAGETTVQSSALGVRRDSGGYEHVQLELITWLELDQWETLMREQASGIGRNLAMVDKLRELQRSYPGSVGPADAARLHGTSVDAWLAS